MHIAMVLSTPLPPREGIGFYCWNLARELILKGHQVMLITRGGLQRTTREVVDGITIYRPPFVPLYPFHVYLHGVFVNRLVRQLEGEIDLIHLHTPLVKFPQTQMPALVTFHSSIMFDSQATKVTNFFTLLMRLQAPVSVQLEKQMIARTSKIAAVSNPVANHLSQYPISTRNISVVFNGVDSDLFGTNEYEKPVVKGKIKVLAVGRLAPGKGLEDFIVAASIVNQINPNIEFVIAGEGILKKTLTGLIARLKLDSIVRLLGQVLDRQDVADLYHSSDVFVLPSHHEGLPTVVLEAMAAGLPVVATMVGGIPGLIVDEVNGLLIMPGDPQLLAEKILQLVNDEPLRVELGKKAKQTVLDNYTWDKISDLHIQLYEELTQ
jgi:glycosyltransferase involved in cell wall biosynthesis